MKQYRILWADDEIDLLRPHVLFLEKKGYEVITVNNGDDALEKCQNEHFDIVFLDENMPGKSGLDNLLEIKDISEYDDSNPAVEELRKEGITENHLILTTNKLIRDKEPVTPYTLDEVAKIITMNALKLLG